MHWWQALVALASGLVLAWSILLVVFWRASRHHDDPTRLRDLLRLLPDVVRLLRRLATDPTLPRGVRTRLWLLLGYLLLPIDLVPDFIPVIGYADDALVVVWALRSVVRAAGPEAIERQWPGTDQGLAALNRLAGLPSSCG